MNNVKLINKIDIVTKLLFILIVCSIDKIYIWEKNSNKQSSIVQRILFLRANKFP